MKILSYNVREGLLGNWAEVKGGARPRPEPGRREALLRILTHAGADVVALQELTTWTAAQLTALAHDAGYPHHALAEAGTRHHLGLLARAPLRDLWRSRRLWHATLAATVDGLRIQAVHLCPGDRATRCAEVPAVLDGRADVLVGDFNAPPGTGDAADDLLDAGYRDVLGALDPRPTRPTPAYPGRPPQRLDLCLVRSEIAVIEGSRLDTEDTARLSDHYPIVVVVGGNPTATAGVWPE